MRKVGVEQLGDEEPPVEHKTNGQVTGSPDQRGVVETYQFVGQTASDGHADGPVHEVTQAHDVLLLEVSDVSRPSLVPASHSLFLLPGPHPPLVLSRSICTI